MPAWNEERNLGACLETLRETLRGRDWEAVVVNDASTDGTRQVAEALADGSDGRVRVVSHERNLGLGGALRTGFGEARGTWVMPCPADFLLRPPDWAPFDAALGSADVIVGCRTGRARYNPLMRINSWIYPRLVRLLFGLRLADVNWICVYRRELIAGLEITQTGIPMLVEILVRLRDRGATFREVRCVMQPRVAGVPAASRLRVMRRTLGGLVRFRLAYRKPA